MLKKMWSPVLRRKQDFKCTKNLHIADSDLWYGFLRLPSYFVAFDEMPSIRSPDGTFGLSPGYFHADPHPGNILATQAGELVYLDFGMMSEAPLSARSFS